MSDNPIELSRRKILAGLGTIGVASAGVGLGTSAYFSDEENFENNSLVAGSLDLKVDWEEHYSDWSADEAEYAEMADDPLTADLLLPALDFETNFIGPEEGSVAAGLTPSEAQPIALNFTTDGGQDALWDATAIEAYPDTDDDGIQDAPEDWDICEEDADLPGALSSDLRTNATIGEEPNPQTTEPGDPLIEISDVKPGDFGEVTFSFHLCDNPGYIWMTGDLVDASEGDPMYTEPELEDDDEDGAEDPQLGDIELLDKVLTRVWRDDGNNQVDLIEGQLDVMIPIDTSGSVEDELQALEDGVNDFITALDATDADVQVGTLEFGDGGVRNRNALQDPGPLDIDITGAGGNTPMPAALDIADQSLYNDANARGGAEKLIVMFTDGGPNYTNTSYTADYTAPRDNSADWSATAGNSTYDNEGTGSVSQGQPGGGQVTADEMSETAGVAASVRGGGTGIATIFVGGAEQESMSDDAITAYGNLPDYMSAEIASEPGQALEVPDIDDLQDLAEDLAAQVTTAETVLFVGTLRQALDTLSSMDPGLALQGDIPAEEGGGTGDQGCFDNSTTHYIGFEWWLPIDHANEIQTDTVSFDLGFYTEQCRHNDGSGIDTAASGGE
jgi:predicted ribosomally synthesized peptide with SipW-like signal peptide